MPRRINVAKFPKLAGHKMEPAGNWKQNWKPVGSKIGNRLVSKIGNRPASEKELEPDGKKIGTEIGKQTGIGRQRNRKRLVMDSLIGWNRLLDETGSCNKLK